LHCVPLWLAVVEYETEYKLSPLVEVKLGLVCGVSVTRQQYLGMAFAYHLYHSFKGRTQVSAQELLSTAYAVYKTAIEALMFKPQSSRQQTTKAIVKPSAVAVG